jgi:AraC-like DNA-binding protein
LTPDQLAAVSRSYQKRVLPAGTIFIRRGRPVRQVGIIQSGSAKVTVVDYAGDELICGYLKPGDLIFDVAILLGMEATASVVILEPTACLIQSQQAFFDAIDANRLLKSFFYLNTALGIRWGYEIFCGRCMAGDTDGPYCSARPPFVRKALEYINRNYHKPITLGMVARETAMSKFHFSRLFKQHLGMSFKQHLNRERIKAAKELISQNGYNVTEAGFAVGFNDASYFSRVFREVEGFPPKRFRSHN